MQSHSGMTHPLSTLRSAKLAFAIAMIGLPASGALPPADTRQKASDSPLVFENAARTVDVGFYPRDFFIDFLFEARGEGAVSIRSSTSTCPCTTVATDRTVYYPGQKGIIAVIYGYRGGPAVPETQVVRVFTDRAPHPQVLKVIPQPAASGLWVERHELHWTGTPTGSAQRVDVELSPALADRTPIVGLPVSGWKATVEPLEPAGKFRITIEPTSDRPPRASARIQLTPSTAAATEPGTSPNPEAVIELFPALPPATS